MSIGSEGAVLLQNTGALPLRRGLRSLVVIGKASQVYARQAVAGGAMTGKPMGSGGGSSDVVPNYTVTPIDGLRNGLKAIGNAGAEVKLILVDDANETATIDGTPATFAHVLAEAARADAVVVMAGTVSEEGADRASFAGPGGKALAASAAEGSTLDWYAANPNRIAAVGSKDNGPQNSQTNSMIKAVLTTRSTSGRAMAAKTTLVLKDNAGVAMDPALVGPQGPAILETWFPGQEDGNIVADLLLGTVNPSGKLPVTFPLAGKGFLNAVTPAQFPGVMSADGKAQTVTYAEKLHIGYRWYDGNVSGKCAAVAGRNPCVAFAFGHGLSYTRFAVTPPQLNADPAGGTWRVTTRLRNNGLRSGSEVVQVYLSLPTAASRLGAAQPPRRLIGFQKLELAAGAAQDVSIRIDPGASNHPLSVWSESEGKWVIPQGTYKVWLGRSSSPRDLKLAGTFTR